jgi:hypothetical protein
MEKSKWGTEFEGVYKEEIATWTTYVWRNMGEAKWGTNPVGVYKEAIASLTTTTLTIASTKYGEVLL